MGPKDMQTHPPPTSTFRIFRENRIKSEEGGGGRYAYPYLGKGEIIPHLNSSAAWSTISIFFNTKYFFSFCCSLFKNRKIKTIPHLSGPSSVIHNLNHPVLVGINRNTLQMGGAGVDNKVPRKELVVVQVVDGVEFGGGDAGLHIAVLPHDVGVTAREDGFYGHLWWYIYIFSI